MKGVELPINILVIVAVAVIVLLGLVALYFSGVIGPMNVMNQESAKQKYCSAILTNPEGCRGNIELSDIVINDFDADQDGEIDGGDQAVTWGSVDCGSSSTTAEEDNLATLLACHYYAGSEGEALRLCGCAV